MKLSEAESNRLFMQYLETALIEFESPHNMNEYERLDVYRKAFNKVVGDRINSEE